MVEKDYEVDEEGKKLNDRHRLSVEDFSDESSTVSPTRNQRRHVSSKRKASDESNVLPETGQCSKKTKK